MQGVILVAIPAAKSAGRAWRGCWKNSALEMLSAPPGPPRGTSGPRSRPGCRGTRPRWRPPCSAALECPEQHRRAVGFDGPARGVSRDDLRFEQTRRGGAKALRKVSKAAALDEPSD